MGAADVLVATDAIGMGLKPAHPPRAVLDPDQVRWRATATSPSARCTRSPAAPAATACTTKALSACSEAESSSFKTTARAAAQGFPRAPRDFKAPVAPNWRHVQTIAQRMGVKKLYAVLSIFREQLQARRRPLLPVATLDQ